VVEQVPVHASRDQGPLQVKILVVSDRVHAGLAEDRAGPAIEQAVVDAGMVVVARASVPDGVDAVAAALRALTRDFWGLVVTTGGTGFGPRDLTPEATASVLERQAPGLAEAMRSVSPLGRLSRSQAGTVGRCLVVNTPGSPRGAVESLQAVLDVVPHALALMAGDDPHPHGGGSPAP
jgi:molybdenum cofactor synthesis domain-containing protein